MTTIEAPINQAEPAGLHCREKNDVGAVDAPDIDTSDDTVAESGKSLLCSRCRTVITSSHHAIEINGSHHHTFFNPAGIVYEIFCFKEARGCAIHGQSADEFSWFEGYRWQFAICSTCLVHLGWFFRSRESSFYGLITSKLIGE